MFDSVKIILEGLGKLIELNSLLCFDGLFHFVFSSLRPRSSEIFKVNLNQMSDMNNSLGAFCFKKLPRGCAPKDTRAQRRSCFRQLVVIVSEIYSLMS